jgi:hypothetical protein
VKVDFNAIEFGSVRILRYLISSACFAVLCAFALRIRC